ncbi:MAG TPA: adenylate/guanylate cyclase domain-containing protein [Ktedonobacteraceae bacterium]|nr:adenylate/guanylate cyclase domain-containing protein [Ktedonobacteraceae bacterium]
MRCPNCQTINPPNAKFCLECGNRLVVCPNCGTVNPPGAKFCIECGTAQQPRNGTVAPAQLEQPATPADTQPLPEVLSPPEERRVVTVMFADITGSTPLADRLDPEDVRAILTGYFNLMAEQIRKHGGTLEKYIGDALMAVFGIPVAHEDDPDRAIRAALDMQMALTQFNEERLARDPQAARLQMHIGINTGEVAAPSNTSHQRQDFLVTGDAVNVAARLQQAAAPDTILVGERTYLSTREVFEFRAIAPLRLKGKPEPIAARVVLGLRKRIPAIAQHPRGIEGRQAPLVGRTLELTLLHASYARAQAERRPHLITILGVPGVGKSRLVREFIAREQELAKSASARSRIVAPQVLQGRCPPYGEGLTYWPLIEILRSLLQVQSNESSDVIQQRFTEFVRTTMEKAERPEPVEEITMVLLQRIGHRLSGTTSSLSEENQRNVLRPDPQAKAGTANPMSSAAQGALLRAWRVLIESLGTLQPLIVVIDDLQWADEALLDLLEYLTNRITNVPIFFLCPARPDFFERRRDWGGGHRNFTTIELETLSREESSDLVDALLNSEDLPETLRYTILTRAEGNPFYVEEIIRMFIDQGILICEEDHEHGAECWHIGEYQDAFLGTTPNELPEDTLIHRHYLLPLPHVPDTIQGVIAARVDLQNPTEKLILQHAAIIGRTFWLSALLDLASDLNTEIVQEALASLISHDFIVETERQARSPIEHDRVFSFKHILIRDVVYNNIPRMRRSREHIRFAHWLEEKITTKKDAFIELLSYHYQQALASWSVGLSIDVIEIPATHGTEPIRITRSELRQRAIAYLTQAGDQALHSYYSLPALQAYNDAYELLLDGHADKLTQSRMLEKIGDAYTQRGNMDEAWQKYRQALRMATQSEEVVDDAYLLALYERLALLPTRWLAHFDTHPDMQEVRGYIDAGLRLLEGKPTSRKQVAFLTYETFWYTRQLETAPPEQKARLAELALASGEQALPLAEELNDPSTLSLTLDAIEFIYSMQHKYNQSLIIQQRRQKLENLLTDREELYDLYITSGKVHEKIADYPTALMWYGRAWSNAQTMESLVLLLTSTSRRMRVWNQWDRWDNAREVALERLQLIEKYQQDERRQFSALETLACIAYRRGQQEEGDRYARQCKRLIDQQIERSGGTEKALLGTRMHEIYLAREDWTRAAIDYKEILQYSEPFPAPEVLATLAELGDDRRG